LVQAAGCAVMLWLAPASVGAQALPTGIPQTRFSSGQSVVPVFEGWLPNADGTFTMVFGYFNRNWKEEPVIPTGPNNHIEPGEPDRGQPTFFLPRRQSFLFRVQVPKDWGQKELIWSLTVNGKTEKAYAQLLPEYEMFERMIQSRGNLSRGEDDPNRPPSITVQTKQNGTVGVPLPLTASVSDDGLPKPLAPPKARPGAVPGQSDRAARPRAGLAVRWFQLRGPAKVSFDLTDFIRITEGSNTTASANFSEPGVYLLRIMAIDGALASTADVTVTVDGKP